MVTVWLDAWQVQCCGEPFAVGSDVAWTLRDDVDRDWLGAVLGDALAASVDRAEEHHGQLPQDHPPTHGAVRRVRAARCRYVPVAAGSQQRCPAPGSVRLADVDRADGWEREDGEVVFAGYLVDLDVDEVDQVDPAG